MKAFIFSFLISVTIFSCGESDTKKTEKEKDSYQVTKETLGDKEKKNPENFLTVSGYDKKNIIGQTVVRGTVTNKASVAAYKDVDVKLDFYSKTGTLLESDKETVYEVIGPGESKKFKTKYFAPKGTDSVALSVTTAKVAEK